MVITVISLKSLYSFKQMSLAKVSSLELVDPTSKKLCKRLKIGLKNTALLMKSQTISSLKLMI